MTVGEMIAAIALHESNGDNSLMGKAIYGIDVTTHDCLLISFVDENTDDIIISHEGKEF